MRVTSQLYTNICKVTKKILIKTLSQKIVLTKTKGDEMTSKEFLEDMIDSGEVIVNAKDLRLLLQKVQGLKRDLKLCKEYLEDDEITIDMWKRNYYQLLEEKVRVDIKC